MNTPLLWLFFSPKLYSDGEKTNITMDKGGFTLAATVKLQRKSRITAAVTRSYLLIFEMWLSKEL